MDKYETFGQRLLAGIIDTLILIPLSLLPTLGFSFAGDMYVVWILAALSYLLSYAYYIILHHRTGQTIGKRIMGIRVVHESETRLISLGQSAMRDSILIVVEMCALMLMVTAMNDETRTINESRILSNVLEYAGWAWFALELITMFTNEKRRAIPDFLSSSVVIKDIYWNKTPTQPHFPENENILDA